MPADKSPSVCSSPMTVFDDPPKAINCFAACVISIDSKGVSAANLLMRFITSAASSALPVSTLNCTAAVSAVAANSTVDFPSPNTLITADLPMS